MILFMVVGGCNMHVIICFNLPCLGVWLAPHPDYPSWYSLKWAAENGGVPWFSYMFMTNVVGHQVLGSAVPFQSEYVYIYIYIITIITSYIIIYYTPVMYIYIYIYTWDITSNGFTTHPGMHIQAAFMFLTPGNIAPAIWIGGWNPHENCKFGGGGSDCFTAWSAGLAT